MATNIPSPVDVGPGAFTPKSTMDISSGGNPGVAIGSYAGADPAPNDGLIVSGAVGIGTDGPLSTLDVNGGIAVGSYAGTNAAPSSGLIVSGPVGIGTNTPPTSGLQVSGNGQAGTVYAQTMDNTSSSAAVVSLLANYSHLSAVSHASARTVSRYGLVLGGWAEISDLNNAPNTSNGLVVGVQAASPLVFGTDNSEKMRIVGSGTGILGIGTPSPMSSLDVNGGISAGSYAGNCVAPSNGLIVSGEVGIGTNSPGQALDVTGNVHISSLSSGGIVTSSSGVLGVTSAITAAQVSGLATVATTGAYSSLSGTPSSLPPNGAAGGDLSGTYPNPAVAKIQGSPVSSTAPSVGQMLRWGPSSSPTWRPVSGPYIYPEDYGAVGNGTADDSIAIQTAFNACASTGLTLFLSKNYSIGTAAGIYFGFTGTALNFNSAVSIVSPTGFLQNWTTAPATNGVTFSGFAATCLKIELPVISGWT